LFLDSGSDASLRTVRSPFPTAGRWSGLSNDGILPVGSFSGNLRFRPGNLHSKSFEFAKLERQIARSLFLVLFGLIAAELHEISFAVAARPASGTVNEGACRNRKPCCRTE
jgi:hypothetical protein